MADYRQQSTAASANPLTDMLSTNLARVPGLQVVSAVRIYELLQQGPRANGGGSGAFVSAARRAGAGLLIEGAIYSAADGLLRLDRVLYSSVHYPTDYGYIEHSLGGDGDPLDICVLSERAITRNEIIVRCRVIGGLQMIDRGEADDKIIAVLENDYVWDTATDLTDVPPVLVERLQHYFLTYKLVPGERPVAKIGKIYGREHALKVVTAAMADYDAAFLGGPRTR